MDRFMRFRIGTTIITSTLSIYANRGCPSLKYDIAVNSKRVSNERGTGQETHIT